MKNILQGFAVLIGIFIFVWIVALINNSQKEDVSGYYYQSRGNITRSSKNYSTQPYSHNSDDYNVITNTSESDFSEKSYDTDSMMVDPADYDSPEDFADDAWGEDFDDWDDAYDYWEENE